MYPAYWWSQRLLVLMEFARTNPHNAGGHDRRWMHSCSALPRRARCRLAPHEASGTQSGDEVAGSSEVQDEVPRIETALTLHLIFHLPLRQAEGFLTSLFRLMGLDLPAPDHTTLSRRGQLLDVPLRHPPCADRRLPGKNLPSVRRGARCTGACPAVSPLKSSLGVDGRAHQPSAGATTLEARCCIGARQAPPRFS